jgi:Immunity protein Imm1
MHSQRVEDPSPEAVEAALAELNGQDRNDLYLHAESGVWMGVGGGPDRVLVTFSDGQEGPHYQAVTEDAEPGEESIIVGGQPIQLSRRYLLPLHLAQAATKEFLSTGGRPEFLLWETQ